MHSRFIPQKSLLIKDSESGTDVIVDIGDIKIIKIEKRSSVLKGVGYGFGAGLLLGGAIGAAWWKSDMDISGEAVVAVSAGFVGVAGALIGGIFGAIGGKDKTIIFEGKSEVEIKKIVANLRRDARVQDYN